MKKFLITILLFLLPIILLAAIPTAVLIISKENFFKIDEIISSKKKYIIGYVYNEANYIYLKLKYLNLNERKDILALGSSRVLQFRENMFDSSFYNAGYTIVGVSDFKLFLDNVPKQKYPKYMIIGLDQWMFNKKANYYNNNSINSWKNSLNFFPKPESYFNIYKDLITKKYSFITLADNDSINKIGLNAKINNNGFTNDGSMLYGQQINKLLNNDITANDYNYEDTYYEIDRIKNKGRFAYGDSVDNIALLELTELLEFCNLNKIKVIAFFPPFADKVYQKLSENGNYNYLNELSYKIKPLFDKYGFELYNFPTVSSCGSSDSETIDGFHGGEVTYQRILLRMLESGSTLNEVADINRIKKDLLNRKNNYQIYNH